MGQEKCKKLLFPNKLFCYALQEEEDFPVGYFWSHPLEVSL